VSPVEAVKITGLADFTRSIKKMDKTLPRGIRVAFNQAAKLLIDRARPKIPRRTGAAAKSLKAASTQTAVRIAVGGDKARYYPWLDFGGRVGRRRSVQRPFIKQGRYLYPTLTEVRPDIVRMASAALEATAKAAGLEVT